MRKAFGVRLQAPDELWTEQDHIDLGEFGAVENFIGIVTEIERHGDRTGLEHAEINRQPLKAIVHEDRNLIALAHPAFEQKIGATIRLFVEHAPSDLASIRHETIGFDQIIFLPTGAPTVGLGGIEFHERNFIAVEFGVALQVFHHRH